MDLFVRPSNTNAIRFYDSFGYNIYQTIKGYYSSADKNKSENGYDMRKSMKRDHEKKTMRPTGKTIEPNELEFHWSYININHNINNNNNNININININIISIDILFINKYNIIILNYNINGERS